MANAHTAGRRTTKASAAPGSMTSSSASSDTAANAARGEGLKKLVEELRANGFAGAASPSPTRARLLEGIEALAESLKKGIPEVSKEETALLNAAR